MNRIYCLLALVLAFVQTKAAEITGTIKDTKGNPLPFSTITIKGTRWGTTANEQAYYRLSLPKGTYTVVCQHVGFARQEKIIQVATESIELNFVLSEQEVSLEEVVVKAGENPANEIIRNAIRKRKEYLNENEVYQCDVYVKGILRLRDYPKRWLGQEVSFGDGDSSKQKILYLSESVARLSVSRPNLIKAEVISTRVSGQSDGYGFANPRFYSFYENIVQINNLLNPRGFVSPIADNAFQYYRYRYEGYFFEEGYMISKIRVIPKRQQEPLFRGFIQIVEGQWRIHSLQLELDKNAQMNFADSLRIEQLYQPLGKNAWVLKSQILIPVIKIFGFDASGSFANVYSNFDLQPSFNKKFFDNTILRYAEGANKMSKSYWDSIRPVPLTDEEALDYVKKDSLEQLRLSDAYRDSVDRRNNRSFSVSGLLINGKTFRKTSRGYNITTPALLQAVQFNTVEGLVFDMPLVYRRTINEQKTFTIIPHLRYGFSNRQMHAWTTFRYNVAGKQSQSISVSVGRRIFQLNNENPISEYNNTIATLFYGNNFLKIYSADYLRMQYNKNIGYGIRLNAGFSYQFRRPLENTTDFSFVNRPFEYKPNYAYEIMNANFVAHRSTVLQLGINFQPGARYIAFPDRAINIGSRWPVINIQYYKAVPGLLGSDADFDKWQLSIRDNLNLKLAGRLSYRFHTGGFIQSKNVQVPDMKHFAGNRLLISEDYLTRFQLPSYYLLSNTASLFGVVFSEYHLNGFLTNKIPGFKKLNWHCVAGYSGVWFEHTQYMEWHVGFENILRLFRVTWVNGYLNGTSIGNEIRITMPVTVSTTPD